MSSRWLNKALPFGDGVRACEVFLGGIDLREDKEIIPIGVRLLSPGNALLYSVHQSSSRSDEVLFLDEPLLAIEKGDTEQLLNDGKVFGSKWKIYLFSSDNN